MSAPPTVDKPLKRTPLHQLHVDLGAKMVPFAGYDMPVHYRLGILKEHLHTRAKAGLFDVSHMGQAILVGPDHTTTALALERLVPADLLNLAPGQQRYSQLLNQDGGIIDDLMLTRPASPAESGRLILVVNAARKEVDYDHISERLPANVRLEPLPDRALIALQGPSAAQVMLQLSPAAHALVFMTGATVRLGGIDCHVSRSGYTGEDGFEISVPAARALRSEQRGRAQTPFDVVFERPDAEELDLVRRGVRRLGQHTVQAAAEHASQQRERIGSECPAGATGARPAHGAAGRSQGRSQTASSRCDSSGAG